MTASRFRLESVSADNVAHYRTVRLAMLLDSPEAFGGSYAVTAAHPPSWWLSRISASPIWLAWDGDRPAGSVGMWTDSETVGAPPALIGMWVAPPARGRGLGEILVATVVEAADAAGYPAVTLEVAEGNGPARALYERLGFTRTGVAAVHAEHRGMVCVRYSRTLGERAQPAR